MELFNNVLVFGLTAALKLHEPQNLTLHALKMKKGLKLDFESQFFSAVNNFIEMNCSTEKKNITRFNQTWKQNLDRWKKREGAV